MKEEMPNYSQENYEKGKLEWRFALPCISTYYKTP